MTRSHKRATPDHGLRDLLHNVVDRLARLVGGRAHARVVGVLSAALAFQGADFATVSATADNLQRLFHIDNIRIGALISVVSLITAAATLPLGVVADRTHRTRLLAISMLLAALAMLVSATANSYLWLLLARIPLGVVIATAIPTVSSLTGDYFPARDRGRMWGMLLGGELLGTGAGFVLSGELSALISWRAAFGWLVPACLAIAWAAHRLPEPARGGQSKLRSEQAPIPDEHGIPRAEHGADSRHPGSVAQQVARHRNVTPDENLVLHEDPTNRSLWWAIRYILRIPTNQVLIVCSALAYFFLTGVQSFGLLFITAQYRVPKPVASALVIALGIGALAGVYLSGRLSDRLLQREVINARVLLPTAALTAVTAAFVPALLTTSVAIALPLLILAAALLGAVNSPLDAARLDIMHPPLWGRAEAIRTALRSLAQAAAPLTFGLLSESVMGGGPAGLQRTFLVLLSAPLLAGLLALRTLRTYAPDVATIAASTYDRPNQR